MICVFIGPLMECDGICKRTPFPIPCLSVYNNWAAKLIETPTTFLMTFWPQLLDVRPQLGCSGIFSDVQLWLPHPSRHWPDIMVSCKALCGESTTRGQNLLMCPYQHQEEPELVVPVSCESLKRIAIFFLRIIMQNKQTYHSTWLPQLCCAITQTQQLS